MVKPDWSKIKQIPKMDILYTRYSRKKGYKFVSFDVETLFTNVPLRRTINVVLDRIYNKKLIET